MEHVMGRQKKLWYYSYSVLGSIALWLGSCFSPEYNYCYAVFLITCSFICYLIIVYKITDRNWLDLRGVFSLSWLITIALANLRLLDYQEIWQQETWHMHAITYLTFQIAIGLGVFIVKKHYISMRKKICFGAKLRCESNNNRMFIVCVIVTMLGIVFLSINIYIRGYIPFFSDDQNAYVKFYTRFQVFAVAATAISGLCYYCIKTKELPRWKKIILYLCIIYSTFIYHTLVLSRGTFLVSALSLATAIYYLNGKRFISLLLSFLAIGSCYIFLSNARNYSDEQLITFFEPSEIQVLEDNMAQEHLKEPGSNLFKLPPKISFLYGYLTISHDNFNEAVQNMTQLSYGTRQFKPFNVIFRLTLPTLGRSFYVRDHLNTRNLISDAYYDFREIGVVTSVLVWGLLFGIIQTLYLFNKGPYTLLALGNTVSAVTLSFFEPWMSNFIHWMHWGTAILLCIACCFSLKKEHNIGTA